MQVQRRQGARQGEQALLEERLNAALLAQAGLQAQLEASRDEVSDLSEANTIKQAQLAAQGRELELLQIDRDNARDAAHAWSLERANREAELRRLESQGARLEAELREQQESHQQRLEDLQEARDTLRAQFADMATKIFDEREQRFAQTSQQHLGQLLDPLKERIQSFENASKKAISRKPANAFPGKELERLQQLNLRLSDEATNLTQALKGQNPGQLGRADPRAGVGTCWPGKRPRIPDPGQPQER